MFKRCSGDGSVVVDLPGQQMFMGSAINISLMFLWVLFKTINIIEWLSLLKNLWYHFSYSLVFYRNHLLKTQSHEKAKLWDSNIASQYQIIIISHYHNITISKYWYCDIVISISQYQYLYCDIAPLWYCDIIILWCTIAF